MRKIFTQCKKEIIQFRRDRLTVALAYFLPTLAIILYGFATRLEAKNIPVTVRNYDIGLYSREYIHTIFNNGQMVSVEWSGSKDTDPLDSGKARAVIIIPPDFSRNIRNAHSASVQVLVDATDVNNARVIKNSIIATSKYFLQSRAIEQNKNLIVPQVRLWFNPGRKESLSVAPGSIAVFLWIFPCLLSTLCISREKEQGTVLQLYASSITSFELMAGKALAYLLIGISQAIVLIGSSCILFQLSFVGNWLVFALATILFLASSVCFGLLGGSRTNSQSAAVQLVATTGFTTSLLLSGFLYPQRNILFPLSLLSNVLPARYYVEACRNFFVRGSGFFDQVYILLALGLAALLIFNGARRVMSKMQLSS